MTVPAAERPPRSDTSELTTIPERANYALARKRSPLWSLYALAALGVIPTVALMFQEPERIPDLLGLLALFVAADLAIYALLLPQLRTEFSPEGVSQTGLLHTRSVRWSDVELVSREGPVFVLSARGSTIRINSFLFADEDALSEILRSHVRPSYWHRSAIPSGQRPSNPPYVPRK